MSECPKQVKFRPDFMAPGPSVTIESKGAVLSGEEDLFDIGGINEVAGLDRETTSHRFYESNKVLGQLYRAIDEIDFFTELQNQFKKIRDQSRITASLMERVWSYVMREAQLIQYTQHLPFAREIRESYEESLVDTMYAFSPHTTRPLSEIEVLAGAIMGRNKGAQSKRTRELAKEMKERYDRDVAFTVDRILKGDDNDSRDEDEVLPRSIACLKIGMMEDGQHVKYMGSVISWRYIAAAVCLKQLERWRAWGPLRPI